MAIDKTVIDNNKILTPRVSADALTIGDVTVNRIVQTVTDSSDDIPTSIAISPWMTECQQQLSDALLNLQNMLVGGEYNNADTIIETATRLWFTPDERSKLDNIEDGANRYVHPDSHPASMIVEIGPERLWFTQSEKDKLASVEENANNYIHPATHPATMITGLIGSDGFILPEIIRGYNIQRVNVRQTVLSGWSNYNRLYTGGTSTDYTNAPSLTLHNSAGTSDVVRLNVTTGYPFVATIANGYDITYCNNDIVTYLEEGYVESSSVLGRGFVNASDIYLLLHGNGSLTWTDNLNKPQFNVAKGRPYVGTEPSDVLIIAKAKFYGSDANIRNIIPITNGKFYKHNFGEIATATYSVTVPNRLLTEDVIVQTLIKRTGTSVWTIVGARITGASIVANVSLTDTDISIYLNNVKNAQFMLNVMRAY